MPKVFRDTSGGKAVGGGALSPRTRKTNSTLQIDSWRRGGGSNPPQNVDFLVVAGGGSGPGMGANVGGGGGGGGGMRSSVTPTAGNATGEAKVNISPGTNYSVVVGGTGANSTFATITSNGGGNGGGSGSATGASGGSGGGGISGGGGGTAGQGHGGGHGAGSWGYTVCSSGGGGGAGGGGGSTGSTSSGGSGGGGVSNSITGSAVTYSAGGGGQNSGGGCAGGAGGGANTGNGCCGGAGGSGVVVVRYLNSFDNLNVGAGLTFTLTNTGGYKIYRFTAGSGIVGWT